MNNLNIEIIVKNYTAEELVKGVAREVIQLGLRYNGKNYYYTKGINCYNTTKLFEAKRDGIAFPPEAEEVYDEMRKALEQIYSDYKLSNPDTKESLDDLMANEQVSFKPIYESEVKKLESKNNVAVIPSKKDELAKKTKNMKFSSRAKKWIAGGLAALALVGIGGCVAKNLKGKNNSQTATSTDPYNLDINTVKDFQEDFNNRVASSIYKSEDKDAKLYLDIDEALALYTYANCKTLDANSFANYFGYLDALTASNLTTNYDAAAEVLVKAYYRGANPNVENLFLNKEEAKLYEEVENLYLECYKDPTAENKKALNNKFKDIFLEDNEIKEKYPEAAGIIGKVFVPLANLKNLLSNDLTITANNSKKIATNLQDSIDEVNCNVLKERIEEISTVILTAPVNEDMKKQIESLHVEGNRNINLAAGQTITTPKPNTTTAPKTETKEEQKEVTREEAVAEVGEEKVQQAEEKAQEEAKIDEQNEREEARCEGLQRAHNAIVAKAQSMSTDELLNANLGSFGDVINVALSSYNGKYEDSYQSGIRQGTTTGMEEVKSMQSDLKKALDSLKVEDKTSLEKSESANTNSDEAANAIGEAIENSSSVRTR